MNTFEGNLTGSGLRFGIISARFNGFVTEKLLSGALDALKRHETDDNNIEVAWVPGAFEIPLMAKKMAQTNRYDAIICLGAVIRGATPHFDYVCSEVSKGIGSLSLEFNLPISFGVLTTNSLEQAIERSGSKSGNKGADAALAAMEMANLFKRFD